MNGSIATKNYRRRAMGILSEPLQFIVDLKLPKGFSVVELGDQFVTAGEERGLAMDWYKERGCKRYWSLDGNGRNGATAWDLNCSLAKKYPTCADAFDLA